MIGFHLFCAVFSVGCALIGYTQYKLYIKRLRPLESTTKRGEK